MSTSNVNGNGNGHSNGKGNGSNGHDHGEDPAPLNLNLSPNGLPAVSGGTVVSGAGLLAAEDALSMVDEFGPSFTEAYEATEVLTRSPQQYAKVEQAIYDLLDAFNVNWDDPNYTETPRRVAKAYMEYWASGYGRAPEDEVTVFPNSSGSGDLVMVKDMRFYSLCSHHLAPFTGYGAVAYIADKHLLGLSKLGRILDIYARRFQLQERIGAQTADKLMELIRPQGVMVVLYNVGHMCMSSRGVQLHESSTTTVATRGIFRSSPQLRSEVMALLNK